MCCSAATGGRRSPPANWTPSRFIRRSNNLPFFRTALRPMPTPTANRPEIDLPEKDRYTDEDYRQLPENAPYELIRVTSSRRRPPPFSTGPSSLRWALHSGSTYSLRGTAMSPSPRWTCAFPPMPSCNPMSSTFRPTDPTGSRNRKSTGRPISWLRSPLRLRATSTPSTRSSCTRRTESASIGS